VGRHGSEIRLRPYPYDRVVSWTFAEFVFQIEYDIISDMTKARRHRFHEVLDTEAVFDRMFRHLRLRHQLGRKNGPPHNSG
jgi:hypothetical protein